MAPIATAEATIASRAHGQGVITASCLDMDDGAASPIQTHPLSLSFPSLCFSALAKSKPRIKPL
jgi:hypothetical protein